MDDSQVLTGRVDDVFDGVPILQVLDEGTNDALGPVRHRVDRHKTERTFGTHFGEQREFKLEIAGVQVWCGSLVWESSIRCSTVVFLADAVLSGYTGRFWKE